RRSAPALCAGAVNVIPGEVQLTLDIRGPQDAPPDPAARRYLVATVGTCAVRRRGERDTGRGAVDAGYSRPAGCAA
ncbi:hypothetical protein EVV80_28695, partial [Klebsiella pneumoniae]